MTKAAPPQAYDFRKPRQLADDVERELASWQAGVVSLIVDRWETQLGLILEWHPESLYTTRRGQLMQRLGDSHVLASVQLEAKDSLGWVAIPRGFAVGMMASTMGEELTETPEVRRLTDVELSVMELALQELCRALTDGQPCIRPMVCEFSGSRRTQDMLREFAEQEPIAILEFNVHGHFGDAKLLWCLSQAAVLNFMTRVSEGRQSSSETSQSLAQTATQIPLSLVVKLGNARVHIADLLNLQPGDVIVLDQRVNEPLTAEVCNRQVVRGWPGRIGTRQAFQVSELLGPEDQ